MRRLLRYVPCLISVILAGCKGGDAQPETYLCPAIVSYAYREPVLNIQSATDSATRKAIPGLTLSDFRIDGQPRDAASAAGPSSPRTNITERNGALDCVVACGFNTGQALYEFTVSATGYKPKAVSVRASYAIASGQADAHGCGTSTVFDGGTRVPIELDPQASS